MAQPRGLTQLAFASGIDEAQQAEVLEVTTGFTRLENVRQDKRGAISKRLGYTSLGLTALDGSTISSGRALVTLGKTVSAVDSSGVLRTYSPNAARWVEQNRAPECIPTRIPMPTPGGKPVMADVAYANGYVVVVSYGVDIGGGSTTYRLVATIYDETEGTIVRTDSFSADLYSVVFRLCAVGSTVVLAYVNPTLAGAGDFRFAKIDLTSAATVNTGWTQQDAAVADCASDNVGEFDLAATASEVVVGYVAGSGAARFIVKRFSTAFVLQETLTVNTASATPDAVAVAYDGSANLWLSFALGTTVYVSQVSATSLATATGLAATPITAGAAVTRIGIASLSTTTARVLASTTTTGTTHTYVRSVAIVAGNVTASGTTRTSFRLYAASKPWVYNSRVYAVMVPADNASGDNVDQMCFVCDQTSDTGTTRAAAVLAARQVAVNPGAYLGNVVAVATGKYLAPIITQRSSLTGTAGAALELEMLDFTDARRWKSSEFAEAAYMTGGVVTFYDGDRVDEAAFLVRPDAPVATATATAGNVTGTNIVYIAIYQKTDSRGNVYWSAPSDPSNPISPAARRCNVVCTTLQVTQHHDSTDNANPARIVLFRSGDNGALPYQRVSKYDDLDVNTLADVLNDYSVSTMTLVDNETSVASNQHLYRQPGQSGTEQPHQCPPSCALLMPYNGMLVGVADDGITLFYSAYRIPGEGVWWSDVFQVPIAEEGAITALAVMDGTLFVFKRGAVFAIAGSAPSGNGADGGLGEYRRLACDVGCIDQRSVVTTSLGVFFQSDRGIELLSRAQSVEWVGEQVQTTLASYPVVTGAVLDSAASLVRFECAASETAGEVSDAGVQLVYDLALRSWVSVDKVNATRSAQASALAYVAAGYRYARLDKNGTLYYERASSDGSAYLDGSSWVTMLAESAWLKLGGIQGSHVVNSVQWLSRKGTRADYSLSLAYDYGQTYEAAHTWAANDVDTLSTAIGRVQLEHTLHDEAEGVAVRVRVSDATPTGGTVSTGQGATWIALTFEGTPREGATALPAESR